jgi:hypothetical protein
MFEANSIRRTAPLTLRERLRRAADIARAFVLLEDQVWEDDLEARGPIGELAGHPHREPLRSPLRARRPGAAQPRPQVCLCPVRSEPPRRRARAADHR